MIEYKLRKNNDKIFIVFSIILVVVFYMFTELKYLGVLFLLGCIVSSLVLYKDIKRAENDNFSNYIPNLLVNLLCYAICFVIGLVTYQIYGVAVIGCAIILYRNIYIRSVYKNLRKEANNG